jgi:pyruvyltransferase
MASELALLWCRRALRSPEIIGKFMRSVAMPFEPDDVILCSFLSKGLVGQNWGDKLNPVLVSILSGKRVLNIHDYYNVHGIPVHVVIGSGLGHLTHPESIVWGQGFANYTDQLRRRPRQICAVRGPLSRQKVLDAGLDCPDVVGDPALLLPRYFDEEVAKRHRIGLIPHFSHLALPEFARLRAQGAEMIDITGDLFDVVRCVKSCHMVASSSLHGLIMADAYGVPSRWLQVAARPIGDGFKFHDYFRSVDRSDLAPFILHKKSNVTDIEGSFQDYQVTIDLDELYESCPFKRVDRAPGQAELAGILRSDGPLRPTQAVAHSQAASSRA